MLFLECYLRKVINKIEIPLAAKSESTIAPFSWYALATLLFCSCCDLKLWALRAPRVITKTNVNRKFIAFGFVSYANNARFINGHKKFSLNL